MRPPAPSSGAPAGGHLLSADAIAHLARLSHLHVEPGSPAAAALQADVSGILNCARMLRGVIEGGPPPPAQQQARGPPDEAAAAARLAELREDIVTEGGDAAAVLSQAAVREGAYFSVPRVVDE
jgi:aspartyl-tRNA(Asn)/glutamyl-tRNA(Gln) amidotransferase subunit C